MASSYNLRALSSAQSLSHLLITDQGKAAPFHGPIPDNDPDIVEHQANFIKKWNEEPAFVKKFARFSLPLCHARAEQMVRPAENGPLKDFELRRAVVSACLTPLRQSIGSCFATAPAILVQRHHLDLFVDDLYELLMTGRLRRVSNGVAYTVPLSPVKTHQKDEHPLLKAWEFTLASFCDVKTEFSKWNLSKSLGLDPRQEGGIGQVVYRLLDEGLQKANRKAEELHQEALSAFESLKALERAARQISSESEARRFKSEEQARLHHMRSCEELRDEEQLKASFYAKFFPFLIESYTKLFQDYFQEIYDPDLVVVSADLYEDRKAGFRLVYKHGRSDSSIWTLIYNHEEFVQALADFLQLTEPVIAQSLETKAEKKILSEITTELILYVRAHHFPKTSWAYISGGTLEQWMPIYFRFLSPSQKEKRELANGLELFVFLLDTLKALPHALSSQFLQDPSKRLLMESPTHVFSMLPGLPHFAAGWNDRGFTYTWVRDNFLSPAKKFYEETTLTEEQQQGIFEAVKLRGKPLVRPSIADFCHHFVSQQPLLPAFLHHFCQAALQPCVFADTNWPGGYFTFVVSPLTLEIEVWKSDRSGANAAPLHLIHSWFGQGKEFTWTVYTTML